MGQISATAAVEPIADHANLASNLADRDRRIGVPTGVTQITALGDDALAGGPRQVLDSTHHRKPDQRRHLDFESFGPANQGDRLISKAVNPASDSASDKLPTKTMHVPIEDPRFKIEVSDTVQTNKLVQGDWLTTLNGCVLAMWVAGSIVMCGYVIIRWRKVLQIAARASASDASRWQQTVDQLRARLKVWQTIKVVVSPDSFGPAVIGFIRPTIILPQSICERRPNELTPILMHEVLHVRRLDLWVGLLQTLCLIVYWFHPIVWWAMRRVNQEIERACDDELLATKQIEPITYAEHLLEILEFENGLVFGANRAGHSLG